MRSVYTVFNSGWRHHEPLEIKVSMEYEPVSFRTVELDCSHEMWHWKGRTGEKACGVGTSDFEARKGDEDTPSEGFDYPGWRESVTARPIFVTNHMRPCRKSGAYREDWWWILAPKISEGEISLAHLVTKYVCTQKQTSVPYILYRHLLASLGAN